MAAITAMTLPAVIGSAGLAIDVGVWYVESARLQTAADAAALTAAYLLSSTSLRQQSAQAQATAFQAVAQQAVIDATASTLVGTLQSPSVTVASDWSNVTVTLSSKADGFLAPVIGAVVPTMTATAVAGQRKQSSGACVLALNTTAQMAIRVDNMGSITASGCGIFADSSASNAIYLNSGTISGQTVGTVGGISLSNSGSNSFSPSPGTSGAAAQTDPFAATVVPTAGPCNYTNASFTAWKSTPYAFTQAQNVFCGNTVIGGNGTTDTFAPGIYYVVNGSLTFNNAAVTSAQGVSFVLTGTTPGAFSWTNYSNTVTQMSAPTTGPTAGILVWQTCPASGTAPANTMAGGSTLQFTGALYTPCGDLDVSNNIRLTVSSGGSNAVIARTVYATGSASVATAGGPTGGSGAGSGPAVVLLQ